LTGKSIWNQECLFWSYGALTADYGNKRNKPPSLSSRCPDTAGGFLLFPTGRRNVGEGTGKGKGLTAAYLQRPVEI